jgi:hypothetical protein
MKDTLNVLFEKARSVEPDVSRTEFGFETRLMARMRSERERQVPVFKWAWRLVPIFTAITISLGTWYYYMPDNAADFGTAVTAQMEDPIAAIYMNGEQR